MACQSVISSTEKGMSEAGSESPWVVLGTFSVSLPEDLDMLVVVSMGLEQSVPGKCYA